MAEIRQAVLDEHPPMVVVCYQRGQPGEGNEVETRAPGVYDGHTVVFDTDAERERLLAPLLARPGHRPTVIGFGPAVVEPPADGPDPL